jgi:hypothetical protein
VIELDQWPVKNIFVEFLGLPTGMTTEKPTLLIRLEPATKAALRKAARAERRSMAIMAGLLIDEGLQRRAPEPKKKPRA